jgi:hypothetical protein
MPSKKAWLGCYGLAGRHEFHVQKFDGLVKNMAKPVLSGLERTGPTRAGPASIARCAPGGARALRTERRRRIEDPAATNLPALATADSS